MDGTFDAWIVGLHDLPPNVPTNLRGSAVVVHDRTTGEWTGMSQHQFEREFEWLPELTDPVISLGDLGVF